MQQEQEKKFIHLASDKDKKVAEKIAEVSKKIFWKWKYGADSAGILTADLVQSAKTTLDL